MLIKHVLNTFTYPVKSVFIQNIFKTGFFTVSAITVMDEYVQNRIGDFNRIFRATNKARITSEIVMACDTTENQPTVNTGIDALIVVADPHCQKANVVGVGYARRAACVIEREIKFARYALIVPCIQNLVAESVCVFAQINQFEGIKTRGRRAGDIAGAIGSGALAGQAVIVKRPQHFQNVLRFDFTQLKTASCSYVRIASGQVFGDIAQRHHLIAAKLASGDTHPHHIANTGWCDVKEPKMS